MKTRRKFAKATPVPSNDAAYLENWRKNYPNDKRSDAAILKDRDLLQRPISGLNKAFGSFLNR